jgi:hypothetical protein
MSLKRKLIYGYLIIAVLFVIGTLIFGTAPHNTIAVGIGNGLVWPAVMFPGFGKVIGALLLIAFLAFISIT